MPKRPLKRSYNLKTYLKSSRDVKQDKQIKKLKTEVSKLKKADEKKWYDTDRPSTAISNAGFVQPMLALNVWAGNNEQRQHEREGNSITMLSLKFDGLVYIDQGFASPDANNIVRIMLVQATDDNQTALAVSDVLETVDVNSFLKIKGTRRYRVHSDKRFYLQNTTQNVTPYDTPTEPFRKRFQISAKIPKKGLKVSYSQGSISGNGPVTNGFYIIAISDSGVISHPAMIYKSRMRFLDN
jgi:hypothetical protein